MTVYEALSTIEEKHFNFYCLENNRCIRQLIKVKQIFKNIFWADNNVYAYFCTPNVGIWLQKYDGNQSFEVLVEYIKNAKQFLTFKSYIAMQKNKAIEKAHFNPVELSISILHSLDTWKLLVASNKEEIIEATN